MSNLIYIASPYTHTDKKVIEENYIKVTKFVADLTARGNVVISPITYGHTILQFVDLPNDWEFWKNFCVTILKKCDEMIVYQMDGWEDSRGVQEEIKIAEELGIKISYQKYIGNGE